MELCDERDSDVGSWEEVILIYRSALKQILTKMEILNEKVKKARPRVHHSKYGQVRK